MPRVCLICSISFGRFLRGISEQEKQKGTLSQNERKIHSNRKKKLTERFWEVANIELDSLPDIQNEMRNMTVEDLLVFLSMGNGRMAESRSSGQHPRSF